MAKERVEIPADTASLLLFRSDRTCCVCRERGKPVQIHHIDENPGNNDADNLAVLCLHCHDGTQTKGGFGRKLDAKQVIHYRDDWFRRVQKRRDVADEIAVAHQAGPSIPSAVESARREELPRPERLTNYIYTLPAVRRDAYSRARKLWDSGNTPAMKQGCYDVNDVLEQILVTLASWYPSLHFGGCGPDDYMNAMIASRYTWHRAHFEPNGGGTGGTMIGLLVAESVLNDLETMVNEMVHSLAMHLGEFDVQDWRRQWKDEENSASNMQEG